MYTVKQAAAITGVPEPTLRSWERRYRVVRPARSSGGYRLYDESQVTALREMAVLVRAGVPAARAAESISLAPSELPVAAPGEDSVDALDLDLVAAAASLDASRLSAVVAHALASGPFDVVADRWLLPELVRLGEAWQNGELTVAQEHFASAGLMRAIGSVYDSTPAATDGPPVVVGLPSGELHELALLCFATCLRRRGIQVVYLGADVPAPDWQDAVKRRRARGAVIGLSGPAQAGAAQAVIDLLHERSPAVDVWVGGRERAALRGARPLPDSVSEAADLVRVRLLAG